MDESSCLGCEWMIIVYHHRPLPLYVFARRMLVIIDFMIDIISALLLSITLHSCFFFTMPTEEQTLLRVYSCFHCLQQQWITHLLNERLKWFIDLIYLSKISILAKIIPLNRLATWSLNPYSNRFWEKVNMKCQISGLNIFEKTVVKEWFQ